MSRQPSRLHQLERSLQLAHSPRGRQPVRRRTTLRLDSGATPVATFASAHAVPLPADIEHDVEVVRGQAPATPSQGLLQLEQRLLGRPQDERVVAVPYEVEPFEPPPPVERERARPGRNVLDAEQRAAAQSFERDVGALLGVTAAPPAATPETRQWDEKLREVGSPAGVPAVAAPAPVDAHRVFDQMGLAMNHASRFDLGPVDLSARLDQLEAELIPGPRQAAPSAGAFALEDAECAVDLADIRSDPTEALAVVASTPES